MKTIEFKTRLNQSRVRSVDEWLEGCRRIWNMGLEILEENQQWYWREKSGMTDDPYPVPWRWVVNEIVEKSKGFEDSVALPRITKVFGLCCDTTSNYKWEYRPACPVKRTPGDQPPENLIAAKNPYMTLCGIFAAKRHPDKLWLQAIPVDAIRGTLRSLSDAWKEYKSGKRRSPHFKSKHKPLKSLSCNILVKVEDDRVWFPKLGWLTCKTLAERWQSDVTPKVIKLCKRPSGWYVQLTGSVAPNWKARPSEIACGLDVGLEFLIADDVGKVVEPPKYYRKAEKRLRRLQRKRSRQVRGSNKEKRTKQKIARLHERIADQRSRFNHKISTYTVRTFGGIAVENINISNLNRRPKPKKREDGKGWERNNAAAKAGLNKSFADAGIGQLLTMIEQKCSDHDREFQRVAPQYTSQDCPKCDHRQKKSLSQRTHRCANCGYTTGRDHAAAENIKTKAPFQRQYRHSCGLVHLEQASNEGTGVQSPELKPVEPSSVEAVKRERSNDRLQGDALASHQLSLNLGIPPTSDSTDFPNSQPTSRLPLSPKPRKPRLRSKQSESLKGQQELPLWGA